MTPFSLVIAALVALLAFSVWRGRHVAIALAAAECPDCRVPLVRLHALAEPYRGSVGGSAALPSPQGGTLVAQSAPSTWEIHACPTCDRVVTTVEDVPSPVADCPNCHHRSLVVYAERVSEDVVVDEWCDLCGRRVRTTLGSSAGDGAAKRPAVFPQRASAAPAPPAASPSPTREGGQVLPFRRNSVSQPKS